MMMGCRHPINFAIVIAKTRARHPPAIRIKPSFLLFPSYSVHLPSYTIKLLLRPFPTLCSFHISPSFPLKEVGLGWREWRYQNQVVLRPTADDI